jgi:N6-adenosine-specific RNA methylase IME4
MLAGQKDFSCIVADPPWDVGRGPDWGSNGPSKELTYPTMTTEEIKQLPVRRLAAKDSHLYIWTINKYIEQTYQIAREWNFRPSTLLTWVKKPHGIGLGGTYCLTTEFILFCTRGSLGAIKRIDTSWWHWARAEHSKKPEAFQTMVESVSPGPYLELFARRPRPGWSVWGNEV